MQIEETARTILNRLSTLKLSLGEVEKNYDTLGSHITNTQSKFTDLGKKLSRYSSQLSDVVVVALPDDPHLTALPKSED
jgi:DNA anti-recombination protein RmuC